MRIRLLTILLIALFSICAAGQTTDEQLRIANERLVKTLDALDKAETLIKSKDDEIEALKKLVATLEASQRTPCSISIDKVKTDLTFWLAQMSADETKNKEILKILKDVRKQGRKSIASQCGVSSSSVWKTLWEGVKLAVPVGAAILIAND